MYIFNAWNERIQQSKKDEQTHIPDARTMYIQVIWQCLYSWWMIVYMHVSNTQNN